MKLTIENGLRELLDFKDEMGLFNYRKEGKEECQSHHRSLTERERIP